MSWHALTFIVLHNSNHLFVLFNVAPVCCSSRYGLAVLSCYGFFVVYALRVNLSVAMVDMLNNTHKSSTNHSDSLCPAHNSPERPKHNHTVSWKVSVEEDLKCNIHNYLCCDTWFLSQEKNTYVQFMYFSYSEMSLAVVIGQRVRLGLWDSGLDLGCLLLRLYPDTDPWGLPGQPMRTQVALGIGNSGNGTFHTANTPGCWFGSKLSLRCSGGWRDWRGRRSWMFHFDRSLYQM